MNGDGDRASQLGRFAAREFLARWSRETGETLSETASDRMSFSYEMGYLRGRSDAAREAMEMFAKGAPAGEAREEPHDDAESESEPNAEPEPES